MGAWGVGGDNGGRRNGNIAEGGYLSGKGGRRESGATSDPSAQERGSSAPGRCSGDRTGERAQLVPRPIVAKLRR